jgi:elongator complex protein 4
MHIIETYCFNAGRFANPAYYDLLCTIQHKIEEGQFGVAASPERRNILRTAVHSIGSPLWAEETHGLSCQQKSDLAIFFYCLRSLIRSAYAVCMLTLPSHLFQVQYGINFHIAAN